MGKFKSSGLFVRQFSLGTHCRFWVASFEHLGVKRCDFPSWWLTLTYRQLKVMDRIHWSRSFTLFCSVWGADVNKKGLTAYHAANNQLSSSSQYKISFINNLDSFISWSLVAFLSFCKPWIHQNVNIFYSMCHSRFNSTCLLVTFIVGKWS